MTRLGGIISGVDTETLVRQLMELERRPLNAVEARIAVANQQKSAFQDLAMRLLGLMTTAQALADEVTFRATSVRSNNEDVLRASGSSVAAIGSHSFRVVQVAQAHQLISAGMGDADSTPVGAGTISIELGKVVVNRATDVGLLNGGAGIDRGQIRITDRSGASGVIELSGVTNVEDVLRAINNSTDMRVTASVSGGAIVLTDDSGSALTNLRVEEVGGHTTANDLGILGDGGGSGTITGRNLMYIVGETRLGLLNDKNGVSTVEGLDDFRVTLRDGTTIDVNLTGAVRISDVLAAINNDDENAGTLTASIRADGKGMELVDSSGGMGVFSATALNSSEAAEDLGILQSASSDTITGYDLLSGLNTVLLRSLNGGSGVGLGRVSITDRAGNSSVIDLSGAQTLQDVIELINADATVNVLASVSGPGNGLLITDQTGQTTSNLIITDVDSTTAEDLGIGTDAGGVASSSVGGTDLELQYISEGMRLSELNGGRGVRAGKFKVIDRAGNEAIIDLTQRDDVLVADVIEEINASAVMVQASINATGDGILITDISGGTGTLRAEEYENGTTAADLNILGSAPEDTPGAIDGSFEYEVEISATDTLEDVAERINSLGIRVGAVVVNDGSGIAPYHLSISSEVTGSAGRLVIDPGDVQLEFATAAEARDAVLLLGSPEAGSPLAVVSDSNIITYVIPGLTLEVVSASASPVTVTVTRDNSAIVDAVDDFVEQFNRAIDTINDLTMFDAEAMQRGILFGDSTVVQIRGSLYNLVVSPQRGAPAGYNTLASIGIRLGEDGRLSLNSARLLEKLESNSSAVVALLTGAEQAVTVTSLVEDLRGGEGIRTVEDRDDMRITLRDGTTIDVDISGAIIVQNILSAINDDPDNPGTLVARISSDGSAIELVDSSVPDGVHELSVERLNRSLAYSDLGLRADQAAAENIYRGASLGYRRGGIARQIAERLDFLADETTGLIKRKSEGIDRIVEVYNFTAETLQRRLDATEDRMYRQFAQMELALAELQAMQVHISSIRPITWLSFARQDGGGGFLG